MKFYKADKALPMCFEQTDQGDRHVKPELDPKTGNCIRGCPVEDLATDDTLSDEIDSFLTAKALYNCTEDPATQAGAFKALGLYEDPKTHLEMEIIYSQWRQQKQQK